MCGTRSTFSRTETKFFAGGTRVEQGQLREVTAMQFARLFPTRKDGYTKKSGAKRQPLDERALWPESKWREIYLSRAHAALDPNREWGQAEANEVRAVGVDAWVREKMQALYADRPPIGIPSSRFLVTNSSPPQAIDRVVKWERTETPTTCGARCRMARGPMCDCVCEGQFHGAGATMSRARFSEIDLKPTEQMASNAARGLELREKHGKGGTAVGVARARDIKNRANLSPDTVRRMHSFFSRHAGNEKGGEDDAGYISFLLWGGAAGREWAASKSRQLDKSESARGAARKATMGSLRVGKVPLDYAKSIGEEYGQRASRRGIKRLIDDPEALARIRLLKHGYEPMSSAAEKIDKAFYDGWLRGLTRDHIRGVEHPPKFKIGDRVTHNVGSSLHVGTVVRVLAHSEPEPEYQVDFNSLPTGRSRLMLSESSLHPYNPQRGLKAARKATMAKFKIGDRIAYKPSPAKTAGEIVEIREPDSVGDIQRRRPGQRLEVEYGVRQEGGAIMWISEGMAVKASRPGTKAKMGRTEEEYREDIGNAIALLKSWTKALDAALLAGNYREAQKIIAKMSTTAQQLQAELKNPVQRMSRPGKAKMGRAERELPNGEVHLDFAAAKEWLSGLSDEQLRYVIKDAREAANAMPEGKKFNYYHDLVLTAAQMLTKRTKASRPGTKSTHKEPDMNRIEMSRPGAKDAFALGQAAAAAGIDRPENDEALRELVKKVGGAETVSLFARWSEGKAKFAHASWHQGILGAETAPQLAAHSWIDQNLYFLRGRTAMLLADLAAGVHATNPNLPLPQAVMQAAKDMVRKGVATSELRDWVANGGKFSRSGAKAKFGTPDEALHVFNVLAEAEKAGMNGNRAKMRSLLASISAMVERDRSKLPAGAVAFYDEMKAKAAMSRPGTKAEFADYASFHPTAPWTPNPQGNHRYKKGDRVVSHEGRNPKTGVIDRLMRDAHGYPTYVVYWDEGGTRDVADAHLTKMSRPGAKVKFGNADALLDLASGYIADGDDEAGLLLTDLVKMQNRGLLSEDQKKYLRKLIQEGRAMGVFSRPGAKARFGDAEKLNSLLAAAVEAMRRGDKSALYNLMAQALREIDENTPAGLRHDYQHLKSMMSRPGAKATKP